MSRLLRNIAQLGPVIERRPLGVFSDIDGTLAPIVPRPEAARITPRCRELIRQLLDEDVRVALITGRSLEMARVVTQLDDVPYAANCGLSIWIDGREDSPAGVDEYTARARLVLRETAAVEAAGIVVEDKGPIVAFHYRRAGSEEAARRTILAALGASAATRQFRVREGRKVIELHPPLGVDKGTAAVDMAHRLGPKSLICLGDDQTDVDMFRALQQLRDKDVRGVSVAVRSDEAPQAVLDAAEYWVDGVPGVEWLLGEVLRALHERRP